jgi:hypothetical protein
MGKVSKMIRQKYEVYILIFTVTRTLELKGGDSMSVLMVTRDNIIGMTHGSGPAT